MGYRWRRTQLLGADGLQVVDDWSLELPNGDAARRRPEISPFFARERPMGEAVSPETPRPSRRASASKHIDPRIGVLNKFQEFSAPVTTCKSDFYNPATREQLNSVIKMPVYSGDASRCNSPSPEHKQPKARTDSAREGNRVFACPDACEFAEEALQPVKSNKPKPGCPDWLA